MMIQTVVAGLTLWGLGCTPEAAVSPIASVTSIVEAKTLPAIDAADALMAVDTDGDGLDTLLALRKGTLHIDEHNKDVDLGGAYQAHARGVLHGTDNEIALIATGSGIGFSKAPMRLWKVDATGTSLIWEHESARNRMTDVAIVDGQIWISWFSGPKTVTAGWLVDGSFTSVHEDHMAMHQRPWDSGGVIVGRLYGEEPKSHGDLALWQGSKRRPLPSLRGVRALEVGDLDGEGTPEALVGDGWHHAYGAQGDARLQLLSGVHLDTSRTIAFFDDDYSVEQIELLGSGPATRLLITTSSHVTVLERDALGWRQTPVSSFDGRGNAVGVRTETGWMAAVSGDPVRRFHLDGAAP